MKWIQQTNEIQINKIQCDRWYCFGESESPLKTQLWYYYDTDSVDFVMPNIVCLVVTQFPFSLLYLD